MEVEGGVDAWHRGRLGLSFRIQGVGHSYWDHSLGGSFEKGENEEQRGRRGLDMNRDEKKECGDSEDKGTGEGARETDSLIFRGRSQRRRSLSF